MREKKHTADLGKKKKQIWKNWREFSKVDERYENHPSKEWLNNKFKIRNVTKVVPSDINLLNERKVNSIELIQDFEILHKTPDDGEYIPLGEAWEFVVWDSMDEVRERHGIYSSLNSALKAAVNHAREHNRPLVRYTSIAMFNNMDFRKKYIHG